MADRWMDERDREWRERDWRRSEAHGRGEDRRDETRRWGEDRSWSGAADEEGGPYEEMGRRGMGYREQEEFGRRSAMTGGYGYGGGYGAESYGRGRGRTQAYQSGAGQIRYSGQSPRFASQDYTRQTPFSGQDYTGRGYADESGRADYGPQARQTYGGERGYGGSEEYGAGRGRSWDYEARRDEPERDRSYDRDSDRRREWEDRREQGRQGEGPVDFLHRAGERISSWFRGDNLTRGGREDDRDRRYREDYGQEGRWMDRGHRGVGPKGYQRSDERINDEVHERLTDDPWLDATNIQVEVKNGEVTLSGQVDNREAKHRAERLIEDLSGVKHVQNNLRVNPNATFTGAGRGFGSSALEAEMRRNEQATDPGNLGASGASGRTSTGAQAKRSSGAAGGSDGGAKRT